jgi:hypothetical protein
VSAGSDELARMAAYRDQMREAFGPLYPMLVQPVQALVLETQRLNGWRIDPRQAAVAVAATLPEQHAVGRVLLVAAALEALEQQAAAQAEYVCAQARGRAPGSAARVAAAIAARTAAAEPHPTTGDRHAPAPLPALPTPAPAAPAAAAPAPAALAPALPAPLPGAGHRGAGLGAAVPAAPAGDVAAAPAAAAAAPGRAARPHARAAWRAFTAAHSAARAACWSGIGMLACVGMVLGARPAWSWLTSAAARWLA